MKILKENVRKMPEISTASLPDIVFMLLFFFMVTTVMKDSNRIVKCILPEASEIQKLENKTSIAHIYIVLARKQANLTK